MHNNLIIKKALARAFEELLNDKPLTSISVKDITNRIGVSRNTFYYHFADKYELINWIFDCDVIGLDSEFMASADLDVAFSCICKCLYARRSFYVACFKYYGQNSLHSHIKNVIYNTSVGELVQDGVINPEENWDESLEIMLQMKTHALLGMITDWTSNGLKLSNIEQGEIVKDIIKSNFLRCRLQE